MPTRPWAKFYWNDWRGDPAVRLCSLAAQGLWMQMLCVAAEADPIGYVTVAGKPLDVRALARLTGEETHVIETLLAELRSHGVFSETRKGMIFNRRMVRDAKVSSTNQKNGSKGGNPLLVQGVDTEHIKHSGLTQGITPIPESRVQKLEKERGSNDPQKESPRTIVGKMIEIWKVELGHLLPVPIKLTDAFVRSGMARWKDEFESSAEAWLGYLGEIRDSPFLIGDNDRGWRADLEWALRPQSVEKVREGRYRQGTVNGNGHLTRAERRAIDGRQATLDAVLAAEERDRIAASNEA